MYPLYRRRCLHSHKKYDSKGRVVFEFDDTWVVPYNPYLLYKYDAHINVEICNSVMSVKYMYKYVYKGHDMASVALVRIPLENNNADILHTAPRIIDEIQQYVDSRYVGASEAAWRILDFNMSGRYPSVMRLQLHEQNKQQILYREGEEMQAIVRGQTAKTTLTAYFDCVQQE